MRGSNDLPGIPGSGSLLFVGTGFINANLVKTDGFDVDIVWRQRLGEHGMVRTELQWTHVLQFVQSFGSDTTYDFVATQGPYSVSSAGGTPQDRANLILGWTRGPLSITGTVRYVGGYDEINWQGYDAQPRCLPPRGGSDCHVASFTTLDLAASYGGWKNWQIFGSVINVFNRMPPFNPAAAYGNVNYNYNWAYSGATGTQFNLGVRYTFD